MLRVGGRRHHRVPLEAAPAADIGLEVVAPIAIASMAMPGGQPLRPLPAAARPHTAAAQRFLRHQHGSVGQLGGPE